MWASPGWARMRGTKAAMPWITVNDLGILTYGNGATLHRTSSVSTPPVPADFTAFNVDSPSMSRKTIVDPTYQEATGNLRIRLLTTDSPPKEQVWTFA